MNLILSSPNLMDQKLLLSSQGASLTAPSPPFLSCSFSSPSKAFTSVNSRLSFPTLSSPDTSFLGQKLILGKKTLPFQADRRRPFCPIEAAVKWRKEIPFDNVIQRDKKLKLVLKIRNILVNQPDRIMSLKHLGKFRRDLGLTRKRRFIALLKRFPAVFEIVEEGVYSLRFRMTPEAERVYLEELRVRNEMEQSGIVKLRKLLMMSLDKRILLEKITHLKNDLGLPPEFKETVCRRYPQYFKLVATDRGPALELTHWDPALAVSAAELVEEERRIREVEERNLIIERTPKFRMVKLPRGLNLSRGEAKRISHFREMPYISPYSDFSHLRSGTPEKEKHACGVVHEILSLTLEKRTLVDHLTHFREEFNFSQQLRGMLIRHPDMFYVSLKGDRDSVFLREAYRGSQLVEKHRLLLLKEKMRALVAVPRFSRTPRMAIVETDNNAALEEDDDDEVDSKGWSDVDDILAEADESGDEFDEDDWSDEEDENPPDFDDIDNLNFKEKEVEADDAPKKSGDKEFVPAFPDGSPRERW
ncbi:protein ROOT PRIMORDIUM DEFECTIVE 1 [Phalaenopsis equestris]|uniref:protein ROOT PRIMORDIUM DEFECTIVE 1 n=1 Tax=Phalaenopsis equestris TaxID=78828 RepID=UPI0009E59CD4|nr:protein ROOT PRIMORDIUM DEFECTIVE 1 [Phalaenopsis equestris]